MRKITLLILALLLSFSTMAEKKQLSALFGYSSFYLPASNTNYVETYLDFNAWSLNFAREDNGLFRATVEVTLVVRQGETVAFVKKYDLKSPAVTSDTADDFTFFDLQRFSLANGIYDLELTLRDKASADAPYIHREKLVVYYDAKAPQMSNIQLMSSVKPTTTENMLTRNGFDMVPYINDFVPASVKVLSPYVEIYNLNKELGDKPYCVNAYVEMKETAQRVPGFENRRVRNSAKAIDPIYTSIDIESLPSGNYNLVVEVVNTENQTLLKKSLTFMRSNPGVSFDQLALDNVATSFAALITDEQKLDYYINALYPIASPQEMQTIKELSNGASLVNKQTFFYNFWLSRDVMDPESRWVEYRNRLTYVEEHFSYPRTPGYNTDRGRVYLQYGPPDFVRDEKNFVGALRIGESSTARPVLDYNADQTPNNSSLGTVHYLPYQLWRYNTLEGDYSNRVFLFWDEFRSGFYRLLNSNARGELRTPFWERMLSQNQLEERVVGEVGEQFQRGY